jgi:hypothetical protein
VEEIKAKIGKRGQRIWYGMVRVRKGDMGR